MPRRSLLWPAIVVLMSAASPTAAQSPEVEHGPGSTAIVVTPIQVFLACRHPGATSDEYRRLCSEMRIPPAGSTFTRSHINLWLENGTLPSPADIAAKAASVVAGSFLDTVSIIGGRRNEAATQLRFADLETQLDSAKVKTVLDLVGEMDLHLRQPGTRLLVTGYAYGAEDTARAFALARANSVRDILIDAGLDSLRIQLGSEVIRGRSMTLVKQEASRGVTVSLIGPRVIVQQATHVNTARRLVERHEEETREPGSPSSTTQGTAFRGLDAAALATGLTDVLLDRAGEQLQTYFVAAAAESMCQPGGGSRQIGRLAAAEYLTQTCRFFAQPAAIHRLQGVRALRQAFESDVREIPERLIFQAVSERFDRLPAGTQDRAIATVLLVDLVRHLEAGEDPMDALAQLASSKRIMFRGLEVRLPDPKAGLPLTESFTRVMHLATSLTEARDGIQSYWVEGTVPLDTIYTYGLRSLAVNARQPGGLNDILGGGLDLAALKDRIPRALTIYRDVDAFLARGRSIAAEMDAIRTDAADRDALRRELLGRYTSVIMDLGVRVVFTDSARTDRYAALVAPARRMIGGVRAARYGEAFHGLLETARVVMAEFPDTSLAFPRRGWEAETVRVFSLAATVGDAQNQSEVNAALRTFIGQARDFSTKRDGGAGRFALNAYVGASLGSEHILDDPAHSENEAVAALALPVGLEYSGPIGRGWSLGAFAPVIDLGAIASARLDGDETTETFPETELSRLFTPGFFLVLGVPRLPLSGGLGITFAPSSREVRDIAGTTREANAIRYSAFLGMDIPLFP